MDQFKIMNMANSSGWESFSEAPPGELIMQELLENWAVCG
jgi:hypothetical protein